MANLYEIKTEIARLIALAEEQASENDGFIDDELDDLLSEAEISFAEKVESVANYALNCFSDAEQYAAEAKRLSGLARAAEEKGRAMERYLSVMGAEGSYGIRKISYRHSSQVLVECSASELPAEYRREKNTVEADKVALKDAIKRGEKIEGVRIVDNTNISIK